MRWALAFLLALVFCAGPVRAADVLLVTPSGYYLLTLDADGNPVTTKFESVVKLGDVPDPVDPVDPPPPSSFRQAVQAATAAVMDPNKDRSKKALAELYRTTAGLPFQTRAQLVEGTQTIFAALPLAVTWGKWKQEVDRSAASFADLDSLRKAWIVVAEVLEAP